MNINLRQMRSLVAIAQLGSFTRAAEALGLSQPSLTVQIRQLEADLGVRVLDRNTRSARLTAVGEELVPTFRRILDELGATVASARDLAARKRGTVRLACLPSFATTILPTAIARFRSCHPDIRFVIKDAVGKRIARMVRDETVDLGITAGRMADPDLSVRQLMIDHMHVLFPEGHELGEHELAKHELARQASVDAAHVARHPLILMDEESTVRQVVEAGFEASGIAVAPAFEATYMATAVGMVRAGLGVAILPSSAIEAQASAGIGSRPIAGDGFSRPIWLIRKASRTLPPAAEAFLDELFAAAEAGC